MDREHDRDGVHDTDVLVVFCEVDELDSLLGSSDGVLFSTPHYEGYRGMLVRLDDIDESDLRGFLEDRYRIMAPAALVRLLDSD